MAKLQSQLHRRFENKKTVFQTNVFFDNVQASNNSVLVVLCINLRLKCTDYDSIRIDKEAKLSVYKDSLYYANQPCNNKLICMTETVVTKLICIAIE